MKVSLFQPPLFYIFIEKVIIWYDDIKNQELSFSFQLKEGADFI